MKGEVYIELDYSIVYVGDLRGQVDGESQVKRSDMSTGPWWGRAVLSARTCLAALTRWSPFLSGRDL